MVTNLPVNVGDAREVGSNLRLGRSPWRRKWQPTPVFLPGKSYGQKSLLGYSPEACKELDTTEHTHTHTHNRIITFLVPLILTETNLVGKGMEFHLYNPQINSPKKRSP